MPGARGACRTGVSAERSTMTGVSKGQRMQLKELSSPRLEDICDEMKQYLIITQKITKMSMTPR